MPKITVEGRANFIFHLNIHEDEMVDPEEVVREIALAFNAGSVNVSLSELRPVYWSIYPDEVKTWALAAIDKRVRDGDFDYADSYRFARKDSYEARRFFGSLRTCCGCEEWEETGPDGNVYSLGFNYGH